MYYTCFCGIPYFLNFYKSKSYKYLKCAYNHIKKMKSVLPSFTHRYFYVLITSSLDYDNSLSKLVEEVIDHV